jgi:threonine dehydratase
MASTFGLAGSVDIVSPLYFSTAFFHYRIRSKKVQRFHIVDKERQSIHQPTFVDALLAHEWIWEHYSHWKVGCFSLPGKLFPLLSCEKDTGTKRVLWRREAIMHMPTFQDVLLAQRQIRPYLARTPLYSYPALNDLLAAVLYVKHENYQPVGAFKVRGGVNLVSQLSPEECERGVIAASTGNHGQSVAYAARLFRVKATIVVPEQANPGKVAAMRGLGADVIHYGENFDEARRHCEELGRRDGSRYIHSGNEPLLIAGVGTYMLEMLEDEPGLQVIFVPIGGGSGAAGVCLVAKTLNPAIRVIGVQAEASPAAYESWHQHRLVTAPNRTFAEGLATGTAFELPQKILWNSLDDFLLVSETEIQQAMIWMLEHAHSLAEGAGAAALAGAYRMRGQFRGQRVGVVCSGGNSSLRHLQQALTAVLGN